MKRALILVSLFLIAVGFSSCRGGYKRPPITLPPSIFAGTWTGTWQAKNTLFNDLDPSDTGSVRVVLRRIGTIGEVLKGEVTFGGKLSDFSSAYDGMSALGSPSPPVVVISGLIHLGMTVQLTGEKVGSSLVGYGTATRTDPLFLGEFTFTVTK